MPDDDCANTVHAEVMCVQAPLLGQNSCWSLLTMIVNVEIRISSGAATFTGE